MKTVTRLLEVTLIVLLTGNWVLGQDTTFTVTSDGKVGIGTSTPETDLEIRGSNTDEGSRIQISNSDASHWLLFFSGRQNYPVPTILWEEGDPLSFGSFSTTVNERMRIGSNGNVGIGLDNPSYKLDVAGDINFTGSLYQNGSPFGGGGSSLWSLNGNKIYYNNGNVGIGLNNPSYKLDVSGDINFTGSLYQNGSPFGGGGNSLWSLNGNNIYYDNGKVGIGTNAPEVNLDIRGNSTDEGVLIHLGNSDLSHHVSIFSGSENDPIPYIHWQDGDALRFATNRNGWTELMIIQSNGNVGIGNINPSYKLDVAGDINFTGTLYQNGSPFSSGSSLWSLNGNKIYYNNGNVGIGNINPSYKLDVSGDINFTGTLYQNGSPFSSGGSSLWSQNGNNIYYNTGKVGIGNTTPTHTLDVGGTIGINDTQVLYLPDQNVFTGSLIIGNGGGNLNHSSTDDGRNNTAVGINALISNTTGFSNTAIGGISLNSNTTGVGNTAIGYRSLYSNITGGQNTAVGVSLFSNTTGSGNTAIGSAALFYNTTGNYNSAVGYTSLLSNTTGSRNTAIGSNSLYLNTTGPNNTAIGHQSLYTNSSGSGNVCIGYKAGYSETGDNKLYIANSSTDSPLIWGDFAVNHLVINGNSTHNINNRTFFVNGSAGGLWAWSNDSDERLKKNIITIPSALEKVNKLRGVNFEWKETENRGEGLQMGFIAQEVKDIIPEVVDDGGEYYSMQYAPITALLVEAVKDLSKENSELKNEIEQLKELVYSLLDKETDMVMK